MRRRAQRIIGRGWYGVWALLVVLLVVGSARAAQTAHADPSTGSIHVVVPVPLADNKTVQGPVGTKVSIVASQATAGATYNLGWAKPSDGCASSGFTAFSNGMTTVAADSSGTFSATFVWPSAASTIGTLYQICASDTANPTTDVITADQVFQVLGSTAPQITLSQAPTVTPTRTSVFDAGGPIQVKGKGFLPVGTQVSIFITSNSTFSPQDYQPDNALKTDDGSPITSDSQGQFTAIVVTPPTVITGKFFLHAVSTDAVINGSPQFPPSLVATRTIQIGPPAATPTVAPSPTPVKSSDTTQKNDNTMRVVGIVTLGLLSLVLFIIGGILVASVALGPRTPPTPNGGTRSQPGSVRSDPQW
jgi:hypothetical protein